MPDVADYYPAYYYFDYSADTVYYCGQEDFELSDNTAMVVGTNGSLHSYAGTEYTKALDDSLFVKINGITDNGVIYYAARNTEYHSGRLSIGQSVDFTITTDETIALSQEDKDWLFGDDLVYDQEGNQYYYDWRYQDLRPVPDSVMIVTTRRIYIDNIGLFSKDDFVEGDCYAL
ncbi:hypothetical protein [Maribellus sediminis]|uniref:hypothetical protein n=1 Tax=Maribellus sediminis TaxID=2696285 RepID=UPI00143033ED|nr:hypothetical protein [Maribellus sediminis]